MHIKPWKVGRWSSSSSQSTSLSLSLKIKLVPTATEVWMHAHIGYNRYSTTRFKSLCSRYYLDCFYLPGYNTSYQSEVFSDSVKPWFCKQSMCQLVTFSSYIVQFSAVRGFNQALALLETCSACWLHMRAANRVRRRARERGRRRGEGGREGSREEEGENKLWEGWCRNWK